MLLLPWIGARDYVDQLGYVIERCPACDVTGLFAVYDAKRKLTFAFMPTLPISQQRVLECKTCGARFGVPAEQKEMLASRMMSQEELSARMRQMGANAAQFRVVGNGAVAGQRTYYQVLQVDPGADQEVIEAAFKRLALKYHPDRSAAEDASERMRELIEAKKVLTNPQQRRAYDASLGIARSPRPESPRTNGHQPRPPAAEKRREPPKPTPQRPPGIRPEEV